jgi:hypothetical protein
LFGFFLNIQFPDGCARVYTCTLIGAVEHKYVIQDPPTTLWGFRISLDLHAMDFFLTMFFHSFNLSGITAAMKEVR